MNIAIITNHKTPYRKLQFEDFLNIKDLSLDIYYIDQDYYGRAWSVSKFENMNEQVLDTRNLFKVIKVVKSYDVIVLGGYERWEYILLSIICKIFGKPSILIFDGVSPKKVKRENQNALKMIIKGIVIKNSNYIFGNGRVSKKYFTELFNIPEEQVINQYLTVDIDTIKSLSSEKPELREKMRGQYNISLNKKVLIYSGRLIKRKKIEDIIKAVHMLSNKEDYFILVLGEGEERSYLEELAEKYNVDFLCTGFIKEQLDLFKHYFIGDVLILPAEDEPWGLVINEAMAAGLPIIASTECGAILDLVKNGNNGYVIEPGETKELSKSIQLVFGDKYKQYSEASLKLVEKWHFRNSTSNLQYLLNKIGRYDK